MKRKRTLKQYYGRLSAEQIANGMNAAARNAKRLYEDAEILLKEGRYPTVCSLAALSIEESGKIAILRRLSVTKTDEAIKAIWREYRNHQSKNIMWIVPDLAAQGARTIEDLRKVVDPESDHSSVLDNVKQLGFYTDCCGNAKWAEPLTVVDEKLARAILYAAKVMLRKRDISVREVELWIEHLGPSVAGADSFKEVLAFYDAMRAEGLDTHTREEVKAFLGLKDQIE